MQQPINNFDLSSSQVTSSHHNSKVYRKFQAHFLEYNYPTGIRNITHKILRIINMVTAYTGVLKKKIYTMFKSQYLYVLQHEHFACKQLFLSRANFWS